MLKIILSHFRQIDNNLPPVLTAKNDELQQYINKRRNSARAYVVVSNSNTK